MVKGVGYIANDILECCQRGKDARCQSENILCASSQFTLSALIMRLIEIKTFESVPRFYFMMTKSNDSTIKSIFTRTTNCSAHALVTCREGFRITTLKSFTEDPTQIQKTSIVVEAIQNAQKEGKIVANNVSENDMRKWYSVKHSGKPQPKSFFAIFSRELGTCYISKSSHSISETTRRLRAKHHTGDVFDLIHAQDCETLFLDLFDADGVSSFDNSVSEPSIERRHEYWIRHYGQRPELTGLRNINHSCLDWQSAPVREREVQPSSSSLPTSVLSSISLLADSNATRSADSGVGGAADTAVVDENGGGSPATTSSESGRGSAATEQGGSGAGGDQVTVTTSATPDPVHQYVDIQPDFRHLMAQATVAAPATRKKMPNVEFWLFETPDKSMKYVAKIVNPPSSIEIYIARVQARMNWNGFRDLTISKIMRHVPRNYKPVLLQTLVSPTKSEVIKAARSYKERDQEEEATENSACPKLVQVKNGNSVFVGSTMNQTVKEMEQRWKSRFSSFKRQVRGAKFDRVFHILEMPGDYTIEMIESFTEGTTTETVKAALKDKIKKLAANRELLVVNNIVGDSKLPTADKPGKYTFYKIFRTDTDECYIGRTTKPMEMRISDHYSKKFMQAYASCVLFRDANFSWKPIKVREVASEAEADRIEADYIRRFIKKGKRVVNIIDPITHKRLRAQDQTRAELEEEEAQEETEDDGVEDEEEGEAGGAGAGAGGAGAGAGGAGEAGMA
jgi:hypothetical protein